jgi:ubiquinone/menaquinone biosynthesis C-methylase UbiE
VAFWQRIAAQTRGRVLELGCGTGRISLPLARAGVPIVGIDRSGPMLARAAARARRRDGRRRRGKRPLLVRGDIRALPFPDAHFGLVIAAYGILQSLVRERDLAATLAAVRRVAAPGALVGIDLVPDVPNWREYENRVQLRGRLRGQKITLVESVRQDRRRRLTTFEQRYIVGRRSQIAEHRFDLTFRTLPLPLMKQRLARAGFVVEAAFGDYRCGPWTEESDTWLILARAAGAP